MRATKHQGPRPVPDDTRRMMRERVQYLFDAQRASWGMHEHHGRWTLEGHVLTAPPDAVAELACARLAHAVATLAPKYTGALMRDELLVWRFPMGATFLRWPLTPEQREEERLSASLCHPPSERNGVLWCVHGVHVPAFLPVGFRVDARAAYIEDSDERREAEREAEREGFAVPGRMVSEWSSAWPPGVEPSRVREVLRATKAPEAADVADYMRGVVFGGPDARARIGAARVGPVESAEQRHARNASLVARWGPALDAMGYALPLSSEEESEGLPRGWLKGKGSFGTPLVSYDALSRELAAAPSWLVRHAADCVMHALRRVWSPVAVAHICDAIARVDAGQRDARMFALPASRDAGAVFEALARSPSLSEGKVVRVGAVRESIAGRRVTWRMEWGERWGQLALALDAPGPDVFRGVMQKLGAEGLRNYVILHRLAAEQGRTGRFRWTWSAHRRGTVHEARVRRGDRRDDAAKREALEHIGALRRAELHATADDGRGRTAWRVVGDAPLVAVVGGVASRDGDVEGLELVLNPELYRAAAAGERRALFTQLPEAVLTLPARPFALAVMLALLWRYSADAGGSARVSRERLLEYADAGGRGGRADVSEALSRALARVAAAFGPGCTFDPVEGGEAYTARPPDAWVAAVVDKVPPCLPPSTARAPVTGAELRTWREEKGLSQSEAAAVTGVSKRTIVRAELDPRAPLPRAFRRATWARWAPGGPVEGQG